MMNFICRKESLENVADGTVEAVNTRLINNHNQGNSTLEESLRIF